MHRRLRTALILCALPSWVHAVQVCELDGQPVNPSNGHTTAGKTGPMRCRDADSGRLAREQELRNGVFMGLVRHYREGILQREYQVNERGNRDGVSREFAATAADPNPLLTEENLRNGSTVGAARRWHGNGQLKRVSFHGEDGREQAVAAFTPQGQLSELRCAPRAVLAPHVDDAKLCGHQGGKPETVALHDDDGGVRARLTLEHGERRVYELLWDNGRLRERKEFGDTGGSERSFSIDGVKRRELQWVVMADGTRTQRITTLDQEFHDSGKLVRERRWRATAQGGELQTEQAWYLNGQPRDKIEHLSADNAPARRDTHFHDNGQVASVGLWLVKGRYDTQPSGVHQQFDDAGRLRRERHHDSRGRVSREREFDDAGTVTRDDEVFEDGSRKGLSR